MARFAALLLALVFYSGVSHAQEIRYVSDKQYVPLRSGAGNEYRIIHRGLISGTRLSVSRTSGDGEWTEVTSDAGLTGWIRSQYLMSEMPAQQRLSVATRKIEKSGEESADLSTQLSMLETEREDLVVRLDASENGLEQVRQELHQLKQISGKAVQLDTSNRRLVEEAENLRSEVEMLQAEKQRLTDKLDNEDFMNGTLAVLLGVIIALVAPRLAPKRRKASSW
ncbi:TIGR04211 family SH3 domain-containing protein [Candidatus Marimicrobium litorale]|uniref:TIGR04211 family SH3 domain-containing protein n=1 Tax=Candidatus Marimicrobium litorale TaxID=2518991 RepID=A0ABT3T4Z0_9GAMM|nr:TIGR04211 family SH3 domain-containing protein [Candidatus Marimicrobium litorale]MCX2976876.1 TIGR04211 family SH3 domain-containing protein [Candidatus Marimicrobium litorale]